MNRTFPVDLCIYEYRHDGTEVYFPQIIHFQDEWIEKAINREIEKAAFGLVEAQKKEQASDTFHQMIGFYEVKTNERNVLSITLSNYAIREHAANGLNMMNALTFDLETGDTWTLSDLFKQGSDYETRLAAIINEQIRVRDFPVFDYPVDVAPEQGYYIADKSLVIYYQALDISPHYAGIPMFPIVIYQLDDLFGSNSLLARM